MICDRKWFFSVCKLSFLRKKEKESENCRISLQKELIKFGSIITICVKSRELRRVSWWCSSEKYVCKGSFFQKVLMQLSYPQTNKPNYFPEVEILNFGEALACQALPSCPYIGLWAVKIKDILNFLASFSHSCKLISKFQVQENNLVHLFEDVRNA
jgi:hypothetical protein